MTHKLARAGPLQHTPLRRTAADMKYKTQKGPISTGQKAVQNPTEPQRFQGYQHCRLCILSRVGGLVDDGLGPIS